MSEIFFIDALENTKYSVSSEADMVKENSTLCVGEFKISCYLGCAPCLKFSTLDSREYKIGAWWWHLLGAKREMLCKRCVCVCEANEWKGRGKFSMTRAARKISG